VGGRGCRGTRRRDVGGLVAPGARVRRARATSSRSPGRARWDTEMRRTGEA
jgi:hypothetical protein